MQIMALSAAFLLFNTLSLEVGGGGRCGGGIGVEVVVRRIGLGSLIPPCNPFEVFYPWLCFGLFETEYVLAFTCKADSLEH
jgi:hypothetical protein